MKTALISTLYNESRNLARWWNCIMEQTVRPDEIVIVDGGSKDGTWEQLQSLAQSSPVPVRLHQQRCNIAEGRNIAIKMCAADIIASNDAGSFPQNDWFEQIAKPLRENEQLDVVGGRSVNLITNDFQRLVVAYQPPASEPKHPDQVFPSSRNIAFRRRAWEAVGGYPEWLTLTAEDSLFNYQLHTVGCRFYYNRDAVVAWPMRESAPEFFKMLRSYGYGAAEARLYWRDFAFSTLVTLLPPILWLSRNRGRAFRFRYQKYLNGTRGWFAGRFRGRRPPGGWCKVRGVFLSPEAQQFMRARSSGGKRVVP